MTSTNDIQKIMTPRFIRWGRYADGSTWRLARGLDYDGETPRAISAARSWAHLNSYRATIRYVRSPEGFTLRYDDAGLRACEAGKHLMYLASQTTDQDGTVWDNRRCKRGCGAELRERVGVRL